MNPEAFTLDLKDAEVRNEIMGLAYGIDHFLDQGSQERAIMRLARTIFKHAQPKELPAREAKRIRSELEKLAMPSIREDLQAQKETR